MNIYRAYLRAVLYFGFVEHAYNMTDRWGSLSGKKKGDAAWYVSERLINEHGYHRCPSCTWATKEPGEHIAQGSESYCYEVAFNDRYGHYPQDEVDGVPAHNLFPQLGVGEDDENRQHELAFNGYDHRIPWDKQPDGVSAFLATPDGVMDRMFGTR